MEEIQQTESYESGPAAGVIRGQSATGDLRLHEFRSRIFDNTRFLRVWLPLGYDDPANASRRYPVLYLNDGQNLFEASTSFNGVEWRGGGNPARLFPAGGGPPPAVLGGAQKSRARLPQQSAPSPPPT